MFLGPVIKLFVFWLVSVALRFGFIRILKNSSFEFGRKVVTRSHEDCVTVLITESLKSVSRGTWHIRRRTTVEIIPGLIFRCAEIAHQLSRIDHLGILLGQRNCGCGEERE